MEHRYEAAEVRSRIRRALFALANAFLLIVFANLMLSTSTARLVVYVAAVIFVLLGVATVLLLFLKLDARAILLAIVEPLLPPATPDTEVATLDDDHRVEVRDLRARVAHLEQELTLRRSTESALTAAERQTLLESLREQVTTQLATDFESRYGSAVASNTHVSRMRSGVEAAAKRLQNEIAALNRRGNLNLVIGSMTTALGVGLLTFIVLQTKSTFSGSTDTLVALYPPSSDSRVCGVLRFLLS